MGQETPPISTSTWVEIEQIVLSLPLGEAYDRIRQGHSPPFFKYAKGHPPIQTYFMK